MENLSIQQLGIAIAGGGLFMWFFYSIFMKGRKPMFTADTAAKMRERELRENELKLEECRKRLEDAKADTIWYESRKSLLEERTARLRADVAEDKRLQSFDRVKGGGQVPPHRPMAHPATIIDGPSVAPPFWPDPPREGAKVSRVAPPANP